MIDLETLKRTTNLLDLVSKDTDLRRIASTGGGEYAGACPFCGGVDRFHAQPEKCIWMCRNCTDGKWSDVIAYVQRRDSCDFKAACATLGGADLGISSRQPRAKTAPKPQPIYTAPGERWQVRARAFIDTCEATLWDKAGAGALAYLRGRGLDDTTIRHFRLGFWPSVGPKDDSCYDALEAWGVDQKDKKGIWLPRGIVIPGIVGDLVWYVKFRRPDDRGKDDRYRCVSGSKPEVIYNADSLRGAAAAWVIEGELNCISAWQGLAGAVPVASLGSATSKPDLAVWAPYLISPCVLLGTFDDDKAGATGLGNLVDLVGDRIRLLPVEPPHKDINDLLKAGGAAMVQEWFIRVGLPYLDDRANRLANDNEAQAIQLLALINSIWASCAINADIAE